MNKKIVDISLVPFKHNRFLTKNLMVEYNQHLKMNNISLVQLNTYNYVRETFETDDILFLNIMDEKGKQFCKNNNLKITNCKFSFDYFTIVCVREISNIPSVNMPLLAYGYFRNHIKNGFIEESNLELLEIYNLYTALFYFGNPNSFTIETLRKRNFSNLSCRYLNLKNLIYKGIDIGLIEKIRNTDKFSFTNNCPFLKIF